MKKDIFLLDMDDTLFDFQRCEQRNLLETLALHGIAADMQAWQRFHQINKSLWEQLERGEIEKALIKTRRFELLFEEYGFAADAQSVAAYYLKNFENICIPFDGADNFLRTLAAHGKIYIVTNGNTAIQKRHIADAGFEPMTTAMFISDEIGYNKPSKQFSQYIVRNIENFDSKRAVWIGDSLTSDMKCAEGAGIDFILFSPEPPENYGGVYASDYKQILKYLEIE